MEEISLRDYTPVGLGVVGVLAAMISVLEAAGVRRKPQWSSKRTLC
jgi:hypothetical protein